MEEKAFLVPLRMLRQDTGRSTAGDASRIEKVVVLMRTAAFRFLHSIILLQAGWYAEASFTIFSELNLFRFVNEQFAVLSLFRLQ